MKLIEARRIVDEYTYKDWRTDTTSEPLNINDIDQNLRLEFKNLKSGLKRSSEAVKDMWKWASGDDGTRENVLPVLEPIVIGLEQAEQHLNMLRHLTTNLKRYSGSDAARAPTLKLKRQVRKPTRRLRRSA